MDIEYNVVTTIYFVDIINEISTLNGQFSAIPFVYVMVCLYLGKKDRPNFNTYEPYSQRICS